MNKHKQLSLITFFTFLMGAASFMFWGVFYEQHLLQKEQMQLFLLSFDFLIQHLTVQGGFSIYLDEFFTQFFGLPFIGSVVITISLVVLQQLTLKLFSYYSSNSTYLLLSFLPALAYWALLCNDFYYLSGIFGVIIALSFALVYLSISKITYRQISGFFLLPLVYWLTGGAFLIFSAIIFIAAFIQFLQKKDKIKNLYFFISFLYLVESVLIPLLARKYFLFDTLLQSYFSGAYYKISIFFPLPLQLIFAGIPVLFALSYFIPENISNRSSIYSQLLLNILIITASVIAIGKMANFREELNMTYDNLVKMERWDQIILLAEKENPTTPVSVLATNLALAKTGQLSSKMMMINQENAEGLYYPYERIGLNPIIRNEPYYHLGLINFSQMYAMETIESTPDAMYPVRALKRVAETFIINGQYKVARKYLGYLSQTLFYGRWAKNAINSLNDEQKITANPEWAEKRNLQPKLDFFHNNEQFDLAMLFLLEANPQNRLAFEYLMAYYLLKKDFDGFLLNLYRLKELNYEEMPLVFQQAIAYLMTLSADLPDVVNELPISESVILQIQQYARIYALGKQQNEQKLEHEFGKTYWYYLHFK